MTNEPLISNHINMTARSLNRIAFDKKREYLKAVCKLMGIFALRFFGEGVGGGYYKSHVQAKKSTFMLTTSQDHYFPERTMSFISKMTWKKKKILIFLINPLLGCAAMIWKKTSVSSLNIDSQQF